MHALAILHRCLDALLTGVHRRRRETLFAAVTACVRGPRLTLTAIGRRFQSKTSLRHGIKRADRLLGNGKLQGETRTFYAALCRVLLAQTREARKLAERLDHPYSDAIAGYLALPTLGFCGDTAQLDRRVRDLRRLCAEQGYALWLAWATCFEGWVAGARGNLAEGIALMERGVDAFRGTGTRAHLPYLLALLSETCLRAGRIDAASERLAEARAQLESSGERHWEAEPHRLDSEVLLAAAGDGDRGDRPRPAFAEHSRWPAARERPPWSSVRPSA